MDDYNLFSIQVFNVNANYLNLSQNLILGQKQMNQNLCDSLLTIVLNHYNNSNSSLVVIISA